MYNIHRTLISKDSKYPTIGFEFLIDGHIIPAVVVEREEKHIICVSCMMGCPMGCVFCSSGDNYYGNLSDEQIYRMTLELMKCIPCDNKDILLSFMGAGEPMMNPVNVERSIKKIGESIERIAISTSGIFLSNLYMFDLEKIKLQLSVHSVNDVQRKNIIFRPKIEKIMNDLSKFNIKKIDYNFVFVDGLNDTEGTHNDIISWCDRWNIKGIKVNKFHPQKGFTESRNKNYIIERIRESGIEVEEYETDGEDIGVSCGQMKVRTE